MNPAIRTFRLAILPKSARAVITCAVVLLGTGYLVALVNLFESYHDADGQPELSMKDVRLHLYGDRDRSLLASVIVPGGKMSQYLPDDGERAQLLEWCRS